MSANFDSIDDARLINAVKDNPVVFDRKHVYYSSMSRKEIAWRSIATICDSTGTFQCCTKEAIGRHVLKITNKTTV